MKHLTTKSRMKKTKTNKILKMKCLRRKRELFYHYVKFSGVKRINNEEGA